MYNFSMSKLSHCLIISRLSEQTSAGLGKEKPEALVTGRFRFHLEETR